MSLKDRAALVGAGCLTFAALFGLMIIFGPKYEPPTISKPAAELQAQPRDSAVARVSQPAAQADASMTTEAPPRIVERATIPTFAAALALCHALGVKTHDSPLNDGTPRLLGSAPGGDVNCEIVGKPIVESIGLMLPIAPSPRRAAAVQTFMVAAGWTGGEKWFDASGEDERTAIDSVTFKVHKLDSLGMITLDMERTGHAH